jgi:hypothetical protein
MVSGGTAWHKKLPAFLLKTIRISAVFRVTCASRSLFVTREVKIGIAFDALADALHQSGPL